MSVLKKLWALAGGMHTQAHTGAPTLWRRTGRLSRGTDGHRQWHTFSHLQRKQTHVSRVSGTQGVSQLHTQVQTQRHTYREAWRWRTDSTLSPGTLTKKPRDTGTNTRTGMYPNTHRCPAIPTQVKTQMQVHATHLHNIRNVKER